MGACRETAAITEIIKIGKRWNSPLSEILGNIKKAFSSRYFIQDNFKTPFNRIIGCKLFGHKKVQYLEEDNIYFCFNCYREVPREGGE